MCKQSGWLVPQRHASRKQGAATAAAASALHLPARLLPADANNVHLEVNDGKERITSFVAGPAAFPVGKVHRRRRGPRRWGASAPHSQPASMLHVVVCGPAMTHTLLLVPGALQATVYVMHAILADPTLITGMR